MVVSISSFFKFKLMFVCTLPCMPCLINTYASRSFVTSPKFHSSLLLHPSVQTTPNTPILAKEMHDNCAIHLSTTSTASKSFNIYIHGLTTLNIHHLTLSRNQRICFVGSLIYHLSSLILFIIVILLVAMFL
jgi:hypothetical protein